MVDSKTDIVVDECGLLVSCDRQTSEHQMIFTRFDDELPDDTFIPEVIERITKALSIVADEYADAMRQIIACFSNIGNDVLLKLSADLPDLSKLLDEPKSDGFTLVNNNTWLPKPLVDARLKNQLHVARQSEKHII